MNGQRIKWRMIRHNHIPIIIMEEKEPIEKMD
jgi:hypothetical protein